MKSSEISQLLGISAELVDSRPLGGGCISDVQVCTISLEGKETCLRAIEGSPLRSESGGCTLPIVVKRNSAKMLSNFQAEAAGLIALAATQTIRVPKPIAVGLVDDQAYLAMEWIAEKKGTSQADNFRLFGERLAELHRASQGEDHGWDQDNYLGSAPQQNQPCRSWEEFFAERRLGFQLRWSRDQGLAESRLIKACESIIERTPDLLSGRDPVCSLLHGDLWSGNYLFDSDDQPVIIDPAVYRGCREAEWGMIVWFGSCPPSFTTGYQDRWPMPDGWQRRVELYKLYHQLNHLNLFGASYHGACVATAERLLRQ
ncbi:fructosamine kinase family protein [Stieleria sp. JC731]|uniref:fructosamine kinase family protein n=1 Tax=Pirellulaceae TaxID=2691357 RepID=UPI001E34FA8E|nr:fructosamine kinase family protein [Stieleria sp. JC731]MCC9599217.1 fructosamine kinase family protein [Stieleria sp. JC731]